MTKRSIILRTVASVAALATAATASSAHAAPLKFTFSGAVSGSFVLDSNPSLQTSIPNVSFFAVPSSGTGAFTNVASSQFISGAYQTLIGIPINYGDDLSNAFRGPVLFTGPVNAPTFSPGTFAMTDEYTGNPVSLTITALPTRGGGGGGPGAPAPELGATWAAALAAAIALALTRRRQPAAT